MVSLRGWPLDDLETTRHETERKEKHITLAGNRGSTITDDGCFHAIPSSVRQSSTSARHLFGCDFLESLPWRFYCWAFHSQLLAPTTSISLPNLSKLPPFLGFTILPFFFAFSLRFLLGAIERTPKGTNTAFPFFPSCCTSLLAHNLCPRLLLNITSHLRMFHVPNINARCFSSSSLVEKLNVRSLSFEGMRWLSFLLRNDVAEKRSLTE